MSIAHSTTAGPTYNRDRARLDLAMQDTAVHHLCEESIAPSTRRTNRSASHWYTQFCTAVHITAFPLSENHLRVLYFAAMLTYKGLIYQIIRTYLVAVKHMHVLLAHLPLLEMPRLVSEGSIPNKASPSQTYLMLLIGYPLHHTCCGN